ncbi:ABC transporter permease [Seleniivibrio sp.]|uniref:ABC transporter permease n=1 Tax=Seleniivibrio sp. TaxID=2898801 RepID=UPI0025CC9D3B|nr:ABC transporter permease [Seleniivibrio sp.]MCD8554005.1 ABC transporter permease [Seleniivibrio sp.]
MLKTVLSLFFFIADVYRSRNLLVQFAKRDFRSKYLGSHLGLLWAFVQPAVTILIFWFVFEVGFKSKPVGNVPFLLWLLTGMVPWFFFAEGWGNATNSIIEYKYLVNKVVFRVSLLPLMKIMSSFVIHLFFLLVILLFMLIYHTGFSIYNIQIIYYIFALLVLMLGLSLLTSALVVFMKDVGQLINMFIQFGFWGTPIFWSIHIIPERYQIYLKLNPIYHITEGFREALLYRVWFWEHGWLTVYFWVVTVIILLAGATVFRKLRPHFADVI